MIDDKTSGYLTQVHFKILVAINMATLLVVVLVYLSQPPTDPKFDRLVQMVEAQDWLIGKTSDELRKTTIELVKLQFGQNTSDRMEELESTLATYEDKREQLGLDLDKSRERMEAGYKKLLEKSESDSKAEW